MATTTAGAAHGSTRNNGATVLFGGNVPSGAAVTNAPGTTVVNHHSGVNGTKVVSSADANIGTTKPYSAGTFGYVMEAGKFLVKGYSRYVSGVANTALAYATSDVGIRRSIHKLESNYRYDITSWDYVTGAATKGAGAGDSFSYGTDDAASPTIAVPGEFVYAQNMNKDSAAVQVDYDARTNG